VATALANIPIMCWLPALTELAAEAGLTRVYLHPRELPGGAAAGAAWFALYMLAVEYCVYWAHRALHASPLLYRRVHAAHHSYNKAASLTPFAGLAFHWADGVIQGAPYSLLLAVFPVQMTIYEMLVWLCSFW
jgi:sterol desaturase/sphingolipid hydroxylase (fatty acid hydroxylase superfamily)